MAHITGDGTFKYADRNSSSDDNYANLLKRTEATIFRKGTLKYEYLFWYWVTEMLYPCIMFLDVWLMSNLVLNKSFFGVGWEILTSNTNRSPLEKLFPKMTGCLYRTANRTVVSVLNSKR